MPRGGKREGAGAKPKHGEKTKLRAFRVPESIDTKIQSQADKANISWSEWLVKYLKKTL